MNKPSKYVRLDNAAQERLRGTEKRLVLARMALDILPDYGHEDMGVTIRDVAQLTGYDRVDVANAMNLLKELDLVVRVGNRRNVQWFANPARFATPTT